MVVLESLSLAWPLAVLAAPLPWIIWRLWPLAASGPVLRVPSMNGYCSTDRTGGGRGDDQAIASLEQVVAIVIWLLLILAVMRPQTADPALQFHTSGRELMIAVDTSLSMGTMDMRLAGKPTHRLAVAREVAANFVGAREGDRVGLIVFGSQAYLHTPLSFDLAALRENIAAIDLELAGRETALGDAIALAASRMREYGDSARILVLVTDGAHNAGKLTPEQSLWIAQREGLRVFTVGIGADRLSVVTADGIREIDPSSDLDENTLRKIAEQTGGFYHRATDADSLAEFYRRLDALEPVARAGQTGKRPGRELYPFPLAVALILASGLLWRRARREGQN